MGQTLTLNAHSRLRRPPGEAAQGGLPRCWGRGPRLGRKTSKGPDVLQAPQGESRASLSPKMHQATDPVSAHTRCAARPGRHRSEQEAKKPHPALHQEAKFTRNSVGVIGSAFIWLSFVTF